MREFQTFKTYRHNEEFMQLVLTINVGGNEYGLYAAFNTYYGELTPGDNDVMRLQSVTTPEAAAELVDYALSTANEVI